MEYGKRTLNNIADHKKQRYDFNWKMNEYDDDINKNSKSTNESWKEKLQQETLILRFRREKD